MALLCYLAITGRVYLRSSLAGLLWPDTLETRAQTDLRKVLTRIKPHMSSHLVVTRSSLAFNRDAPYWLDVADFEAGVASRTDVKRLQHAVSLYHGDFLDGFYLPDAPLFDGWVLAQRARLREAMLFALHTLITHFSSADEYGPAMTYARQLLTIEPWHEEMHRDLMRLLVLSGQRGAALVQFETCRRILDDELGVAPADETLALYNHIRMNERMVKAELKWDQPGVAAGAQRPVFLQDETNLPPLESTLFVAREPELARLDRILDRAIAGRSQVAFLVGEAGSGKTALLEAFIGQAQAKRADLVAVVGNCSAYTGMGDPYLPFRTIAAQLSGDVESRWRAGSLSREQARRLWGVAPHMAAALANVGSDLWETFVSLSQFVARGRAYSPGDTTWVKQLEAIATTYEAPAGGPMLRQRLFEQYGEVLALLARQAPLLLVVDDLQWADLGSISLLFHLGRQLTTQPILILGAYRPVDIATGRQGERHPLRSVVGEFQRRFGDILLDLGQSANRDFVEAFLDRQPNQFDAAFRERLFRQTRGHPLFTIEMWQDLQERGAVHMNDAGEWIAGSAIDWKRLPTRVEVMIGERINRLEEPAQNVLRVASVEGETFTAEVAAHVLKVSERSVVTQLSHDLDKIHRLVQVEDVRQLPLGRLSQYKFRHILIQNYLYNRLDEAERTYLHEAIGEELEAIYSAEKQSIALQLAWHFRQAGRTTKAVAYLHQGSQQALGRFAGQEAVALCHEALALLQALPDTPARSQQELALQMTLGSALQAIEGFSVAGVEAAYARALELCRLAEDSVAIFPALVGLWTYYLLRGDLGRARDLAEQLLVVAQQATEPAVHLGVQFALGVSLFFLGAFEAAYQHLEVAVALADSQICKASTQNLAYDPSLLAHCFAAIALWFIGRGDRGLKLGLRGLERSRDSANPFTLINSLNYVALLHHFRGEVEETSTCLEEALALSIRHGYPHMSALAIVIQGWVLVRRGQLDLGIKRMRAGLEQLDVLGAGLVIAHFNCILAEAYSQADEMELAWQTLEKAFAYLDAGPFWEAELYRLRGELLIRRGGTPADIETAFRMAFETASRQRTRMLVLRTVTSLARWHAQLGKRTEAHRVLAEVYGEFTEALDTPDLKEAKALLDSVSPKELFES